MSEATRLPTRPWAARWHVAPIQGDRSPTSGKGLALTPTSDLVPRVLRPADQEHPFTWIGAHGGAGATSLCLGSRTGADLTQLWPDPLLGWPAAAAVVFRSSAAGLDAASRLVSQAVSGALRDIELVALVAVADSPAPAPEIVRRRLRVIGRLAPLCVEVPWVEEWREAPYTVHLAAAAAAERILEVISARSSRTT